MYVYKHVSIYVCVYVSLLKNYWVIYNFRNDLLKTDKVLLPKPYKEESGRVAQRIENNWVAGEGRLSHAWAELLMKWGFSLTVWVNFFYSSKTAFLAARILNHWQID